MKPLRTQIAFHVSLSDSSVSVYTWLCIIASINRNELLREDDNEMIACARGKKTAPQVTQTTRVFSQSPNPCSRQQINNLFKLKPASKI